MLIELTHLSQKWRYRAGSNHPCLTSWRHWGPSHRICTSAARWPPDCKEAIERKLSVTQRRGLAGSKMQAICPSGHSCCAISSWTRSMGVSSSSPLACLTTNLYSLNSVSPTEVQSWGSSSNSWRVSLTSVVERKSSEGLKRPFFNCSSAWTTSARSRSVSGRGSSAGVPWPSHSGCLIASRTAYLKRNAVLAAGIHFSMNRRKASALGVRPTAQPIPPRPSSMATWPIWVCSRLSSARFTIVLPASTVTRLFFSVAASVFFSSAMTRLELIYKS